MLGNHSPDRRFVAAIGQVMDEAVKVLNKAMTKFNLDLSLEHALIGGAAHDVHGTQNPLMAVPCPYHIPTGAVTR